jgi:hypothetical protein
LEAFKIVFSSFRRPDTEVGASVYGLIESMSTTGATKEDAQTYWTKVQWQAFFVFITVMRFGASGSLLDAVDQNCAGV